MHPLVSSFWLGGNFNAKRSVNFFCVEFQSKFFIFFILIAVFFLDKNLGVMYTDRLKNEVIVHFYRGIESVNLTGNRKLLENKGFR